MLSVGSPATKDFRAIKSAVSLKLHAQGVVVGLHGLFPRHQKRGLIEAGETVAVFVGKDQFPRHQKRGLIEAP